VNPDRFQDQALVQTAELAVGVSHYIGVRRVLFKFFDLALSPQAGPSFPLYLPMSLSTPLSPGGVFFAPERQQQ
jgi:hypothetical protein